MRDEKMVLVTIVAIMICAGTTASAYVVMVGVQKNTTWYSTTNIILAGSCGDHCSTHYGYDLPVTDIDGVKCNFKIGTYEEDVESFWNYQPSNTWYPAGSYGSTYTPYCAGGSCYRYVQQENYWNDYDSPDGQFTKFIKYDYYDTYHDQDTTQICGVFWSSIE